MNLFRKKVLFWAVLLGGLGYISGFFSRPQFYYRCTVELSPGSRAAQNVTLTVPFPYYDPLPWIMRFFPVSTARPVAIIAHAFQPAAAAKKVSVTLIDDHRRGTLLNIFIPQLNHSARSFLSHKLVLEFPESFPLPFFITPAYLFKQPAEVFFLNPHRTTIYWDEKDRGFVVNKKHYTYARVEGDKKNVSVRVVFTVKKRYFFGAFNVRYEMMLPARKAEKASTWIKLPLILKEKKALF